MVISNVLGETMMEMVDIILVISGVVVDPEAVHEVSVVWTGVAEDSFADRGEETVGVIRLVVNPIRNSNKNAIEQCTVKHYNNAVRS